VSTKYIVQKALSYKIMQAVFEVHNQLGPGFLENIYEEALAHEFSLQKISFARQKIIQVSYKGKIIGQHRLDMVINNEIILELKAVSELADIHKQQLLSYLKSTGLPLGILINFGTSRVQYTRIVN